jgi:pimeloyl-ACP methyl ester carboxylesterase
LNNYISTNGVKLNVIQEGPEKGPLLILLHGFPEFSYAWKAQTPYFAKAGYRVWVPDQRGSNLSDKPPGITAYNVDELAADIIGLLDAAEVNQAYIVGHDWGAFVLWWIAAKYPDRIKKMVILNVPHWRVMTRNLKINRQQKRKSRYMLFFQLPWLPEWLARRKNWRQITRMLTDTSLKGTFSQKDLDIYRNSWSQPQAYKSMLNWYRAAFRKAPPKPKSSNISVPTLIIWGEQDVFLGSEMAQESLGYCEDGKLIMIAEAGHWLHHEDPDSVNSHILDFFRGD